MNQECPVLLANGTREALLPLDGGAAIEVHAPEWETIPLPGQTAVRCRLCPVVHVGHEPTERQHARYRPASGT